MYGELLTLELDQIWTESLPVQATEGCCSRPHVHAYQEAQRSASVSRFSPVMIMHNLIEIIDIWIRSGSILGGCHRSTPRLEHCSSRVFPMWESHRSCGASRE